MAGKSSKSYRHYIDPNIFLMMVVIIVVTILVWGNVSMERNKLIYIEDSLRGYMGYLKDMVFSSAYDSLKKGNMKVFNNILNEIGDYEYVSEFSLVTPDGVIKYSSVKDKMGSRDSNVIGLKDKKNFDDRENTTYYFPVTTVSYCTRCHMSWELNGINSFYKVSLSRQALLKISYFTLNTYAMVVLSGIIMVVFVYMFFYAIRKRISEDTAIEGEKKFRSLFENIMDVQYSTDIHGNLTLISPSGVRLLGYDDEEEMKRYGLGQRMFFDIDERRTYLKTLAAQGEVKNYEIRLKKKDNSPVVVEMNTKVLWDNQKNPVSIEGIFRDVTYRKEYEKQLELMGIVFDTTVESIIITNSRGVVNKVNQAFTEITGYRASDIIGRTPKMIRSNLSEAVFIGAQKELFRTGKWSGEVWNKKANGDIYPEWLSVTSIKDEKGEVTHYVLVGHDITEQKRSEEQLKFQAYHDTLTGLPNRELLGDRIDVALAYSARHGKKLAVMFVDLDNFKYINDTAGHHVGDVFLKEIASILKESCRDEDTVARIGGDEFVILLPDIENETSAENVAERIFEALSETIVINGYRLMAGASMGMAFFPKDGESVTELLRNADTAMYHAKQHGKGHFEKYNSTMDVISVDRTGIEADIRRGLKKREFIVYYQPVTSLIDGCVKGFEALVRWRREDGSITMPGDFIDVAEQSLLINELGDYVLRETCQVMERMAEKGYGYLSYSVNVSSRQFQNPEFPIKVKKTLEEFKIAPHKLIFEITENTVVMDIQAAIKTMKIIKGYGIRISLDDFGTGYSSLMYLQEFPVSILKIDRTFTRDIFESIEQQHIVDAIVSLAKNFEMLVIAEGVENTRQIAHLKKIHCDFIQGFYFAKPMPEEDMVKLLDSGRKLEIS